MQTIDLKPAPDHLLTPRLRLEAACAAHAQPFADGLSASMGSLTYVAWGIRPHDVDWARRFWGCKPEPDFFPAPASRGS